MRLQNWFIRNLDDIQREVIIESIDKNIIVQGVAGSGKTNLAIHRALQAKGKGLYAIVIMTVALRRMISYGMNELGLDNERIAYKWAWQNRGFDLIGDVYCIRNDNGAIESSPIYLVNNNKVRKFVKADKGQGKFGIDFADWVPSVYYCRWGRRSSWFNEVNMDGEFSISNSKYWLVPSGTLYKPSELIIDYLIVDEAQDFNITQYQYSFLPKVGKSLSLLGDSHQKMNKSGSSMEKISGYFSNYKNFYLKYNYRLPKTIAKVAQKIHDPEIDLVTNNLKDGGNSDFPNYPKPIIKRCSSREEEIRWIASKIMNEALDDVAILVPDSSDVQEVVRLLGENGITEVQTHYRTGKTVPFHTINTLDFSNNDLPCILDYFAAKGSEFDNVFIPFANSGSVGDRYDFFVACTRSSHSLYITYTNNITSFLRNVNRDDIVELN